MKNNKILKTAYIITIIIMLVFSTIGISYASQKDDLEKEQEELDKKIEETSSEIAGVKSQMSQALSQISRLNTQISSYENEISDMEKQLQELEGQITEKQTLVTQKQEEFDSKKELLSKRILAMYEAGTTSYLDVLLSSESLSDFLSKYYIIDQLVEADQELLEEIEVVKNTLETEKQTLENTKKEIQNTKEVVQSKSDALTVSVKEKNNLVTNLTEEEKILQEQLEEFENDKKDVQRELEKYLSNNNNNNNVIVAPSAAGYISPLKGKTKANITTTYYGYSGHTGVDWACAAGTPILAVKDGTVVTSTALKRANGTYKSYGEYIIIDHHDGTMTLYAHGSPGSRLVDKGDKVSQGQQIMSVGTTGNSTGNHLHFEVRVNARPVNPAAYLP